MFRWNSWNHFGCDINESLIRDTGIYVLYIYYDVLQVISFTIFLHIKFSSTDMYCIFISADAMVSTGLTALGYKYINLGKRQL